ncbi:MAG: hypothetical protein M3N98_10830, partial [Actinomycetota bacterium]|nr:hypothetical protein [Actinomycetota bacterium]
MKGLIEGETARVRPQRLARWSIAFSAVPVGALGIALVVAAMAAVSDPNGPNPAGAAALTVAGIVVLAVCKIMRRWARDLSREECALAVGADSAGLKRRRQLVALVHRHEVGVVVIQQAVFS